jgi:di/tricarboxylate transporter
MNDWGLVEAVVGPNSHIEGKTLGEINFRDRYRLNILSLVRGSQMFDADLDESRLKIGDTLLLAGPWENFRRLGAEQPFMFIFCDKIREKQVAPIKAFWAGLWFLVALILILGFRLHLSVGLLTGALGMVLTRVLTIDEAYRSVDWRTIFLLAGLIPLGLASMETGAAAFVVQKAMPLLTQIPPLVAFVALGAITTLFTLLVSNVGAVILLTPLAVSMADQIGADPRTAALLVALATSNSFMLPTHQVNALYMGAGRYHTVDFIRAGSIMSVIFLGVLILALHVFYGLN